MLERQRENKRNRRGTQGRTTQSKQTMGETEKEDERVSEKERQVVRG